MRISIFGFIFLLLGCSKEKDFVPIYNVENEFKPFVETFKKEAFSRGLTIDITNLIIKYDKDLDKSFCAVCNSASLNANIQKVISVNPNVSCWDYSQSEEALIFHELGHCILGRTHSEELLPNGDAKSIMIKDDINLYSPCVYDIDGEGSCNFTFKRTYYIDELFNENTPIPDWAK